MSTPRGIQCHDTTRTIFAAGCKACIDLRMVAPSFVTMTSPLEVEI